MSNDDGTGRVRWFGPDRLHVDLHAAEEPRINYDLGEGRMLQVVLTADGVVFDAFDQDVHVGTHALTAGEWFELIDGRP